MPTVVVATGNPGKLQEMQTYLDGLDWTLKLKPPELEVEETGETFLANARLKASQVAIATGHWAIADDSGLVVEALNGSPGIYSARYGKSDAERIKRVLTELGETSSRGAYFVCAIALARSNGVIALETEGVCRGEILRAPRGTSGFGYDPIFYVPEQGKTFAEMTPLQKRRCSHRGIAFQQLTSALRSYALE